MLLTTVRVARSRPTDQNRTSPSCPPKAMAAHAGPRGERPALPRTELARQRSPFPLLRSSASTTARGSRRSRRERPAPNPRYRHPVAYRAPPAIAVLAEGRPRWVGHPEEPLSNVGAGTAGVGFGVAGAEFASSPVEVLWVIACSALLVRPCRMCGVLVLHRRHRPGRSPPRIGAHGLRHTYATGIRAGVSPEVVSQRLGHASVVITLSLYAHVFEQDDQAAAELTADAIFGH